MWKGQRSFNEKTQRQYLPHKIRIGGVDKAKRAVFSVITYGENDKILNTGNGFFVTEDGVALSISRNI